ncbi:MAG: amidohydrolase family protein [Candidatus Aenigmatarchaeota archaeon]
MVKKETIPLLYDHHTHTAGYTALLDSVDLSEIREKDQALSLIKEDCSEDKANVVLGWNNSYYSFSRTEVEELPPVVICNLSFHGFIFNEKAEEKVKKRFDDAEILKKINDPYWMERNLPAIMKFLVKLEGLDEEKLDVFFDFLSDNGIWRTDDMLLPGENIIELFKDTGYDERTDFWADLQTYEELSEDAKGKVKGVKLFTDGALGPSTAALKEKYTDGSEGILIYSDDGLEAVLRGLESLDVEKTSIHAIGNRATEQIVRSIKKMEKSGAYVPKTRIEHAQFISKSTAKDAKRLGIKLSMQPNFSLDSIHYSDRLPENYVKRNNPFRMLIDHVGFIPGEDLIFGSDGMPYGVKPALESSLFPPYDGQKLTLHEFKDGFCLKNKKQGSIEVHIGEKEEEVAVEKINI